jgi:hypothetical protein
MSLAPADFEKGMVRIVLMSQQASNKISKMPFRIPTAGFAAAARAIRGLAASLASLGKGGLSGIGASFLVGGWTGIGGAIAGIGKQMTSGVADAYEYGRQMLNLSRATGIATEKMPAFSLALEDSKLGSEQLIVAMRLMSQHLLKASEGQYESVHAFNQLGLSWKALLHMPIDETFEKVGKTIAAVENPALRSAAAIRHFGDTGAKTLKLFSRGGAMDMAREALGKQSGIVGGNGAAFEKIAIRISHIGVKMRGVFIGIADAILPMVDKFSAIFHKMDFTDWGLKIGKAINDAMAWMVVFWEKPGQTMDYFWETAKLKAMELGATLLDAVDKAFPGMADSLSDMVLKTQAWGKTIVGYAVDFGQHMLAGVQTFIAAFKDGWEATGIPEVMRWMKEQGSKKVGRETPEEQTRRERYSLWFPGGEEKLTEVNLSPERKRRFDAEQAMQSKVDAWGKSAKGSDPNSFDNILKKVRGNNSGSALTKQGEADLVKAHGEAVMRSFSTFFPPLGGNKFSGTSRMQAALDTQRRKAALAGAPLQKPLADARASLGQTPFVPGGSKDFWDFTGGKLKDVYGDDVAAKKNNDWKKAFATGERRNHMGATGVMGALLGGPMGVAARAANMGIEGVSAAHNKELLRLLNEFVPRMSGMSSTPYGQSPILRHLEQFNIRSARIAARSGRIMAAGQLDNKPYFGDFSDKRRPGETANGDRQRAKAFAREVQRKEAHHGTDNQLLGDIAENTAAAAKNTAVFAQ